MKIVTLGCSHTRWHTPTWADILINEGYDVHNYARPGQGNFQSLYKVYDIIKTYGIENTLVVLQVTYPSRVYDYFMGTRVMDNNLSPSIIYRDNKQINVHTHPDIVSSISDECTKLQLLSIISSIESLVTNNGGRLIIISTQSALEYIEKEFDDKIVPDVYVDFMTLRDIRYQYVSELSDNRFKTFIHDETHDAHMNIIAHKDVAEKVLAYIGLNNLSDKTNCDIHELHEYLLECEGYFELSKVKNIFKKFQAVDVFD